MKVQAKCITNAWDSNACVMFVPGGGPLPDGLYEIEHDGVLASLRIGLKYVFEFDRNSLSGQKRDYTCDQCGKECKTLNELGSHVYSQHPVGSTAPASEPEPEVFADRTCPECNRVCKSPYGMRVHMDKAHGIARVQPAVPVPNSPEQWPNPELAQPLSGEHVGIGS